MLTDITKVKRVESDDLLSSLKLSLDCSFVLKDNGTSNGAISLSFNGTSSSTCLKTSPKPDKHKTSQQVVILKLTILYYNDEVV